MFIEPKFNVSCKDSDLMIRGMDFYAVFDENSGLWIKDERLVIDRIDEEIWKTYEKLREENPKYEYIPLLMRDSDSGSIDKFHKYCKLQMRDNYKPLDEKIIFMNQEVKKEDYASKRLAYDICAGKTPAYDELIGTLYEEEERKKLEWAIGSIISGDSIAIQKFIVLYGEPGTGKGTFLDLLMMLFDGYWTTFNAKAIGSGQSFALASFKDNPLVAIQTDGNLSRIEDNTLLNAITSHEYLEVNEKHKAQYTAKFNAFLFLGTNDPVKITNAKSGILRRLIDVYPSGKQLPPSKYLRLKRMLKFELGAIAQKCLDTYNSLGDSYYMNYIPIKMLSETNDFYDFMDYHYEEFASSEFVVLQDVWTMYKAYVEMAQVRFPLPRRQMQIELGTYFREHKEQYHAGPKEHYRNVYFGFRTDKFIKHSVIEEREEGFEPPEWLKFNSKKSALDVLCSNDKAQLANEEGNPRRKWDNLAKTQTLSTIDTRELHWLKFKNTHHIVIDFDLTDENGEKSLIENLKAASKFPPTYAELSKSGKGIHLHYIYQGDVEQLARLYSVNIEIKVFTGNSSLRRKLTLCNSLSVVTISSGLPLVKKEKKTVVDDEILKSEYALIQRICNCLKKKYHDDTTSNVNYIKHSLDVAYEKGFTYDVSRLKSAIFDFAAASTNQSTNNMKTVQKMHFKSKDLEPPDEKQESSEQVDNTAPIAVFDIEVYQNVLFVNWSFEDEDVIHHMINPTPIEVASLFKYRLVGFNCIRYDNIILYMRAQGATNMAMYKASQAIIKGGPQAFDRMTSYSAKSVSYLDLYDVATKKQSLKKWEIELHIHHKECQYDWDLPLPEDKWQEVSDYCDNDVKATKAVMKAIKGDIKAREIASVISGLSMNSTDNAHTAKYIFGDDKGYKDQFVYTDLTIDFPGYKFENGKSTYYGEEVGEGGAVRAEPGMYEDVWVFDVLSMHPHSIKALNLFGPKYTKRFYDLVELRAAIKHGLLDKAKEMFDGKLIPYLEDASNLKAIAQALKIMINSVYGLTAAKFDNPFRDPRNVDNIVAKRGALFILELKRQLEAKGVKVIHVKTDSIKVTSPSEETKKFIYSFAERFGYQFEIEHIYKKFCLVNNAVYIAKYAEPEIDNDREVWWDATGKEFQRPVVYKTLFSGEPLEFYDLCETREVRTSMYIDFNENNESDESKRHFIGKVGLFCPVSKGGGALKAKRTNKDGVVTYANVTDTSGYKWLEAEDIDKDRYTEIIDMNYYNKVIDSAKKHIEEFGDYEEFIK